MVKELKHRYGQLLLKYGMLKVLIENLRSDTRDRKI